MLHCTQQLDGFAVHATDGAVGSVVSLVLDDESWTLPYLVVALGRGTEGRRVLIPTVAIQPTDMQDESFQLALDRSSIRNAPPCKLSQPVSRRQEQDLLQYYGHTRYWGSTHSPLESSVHLRNAGGLRGYEVRCFDEAAGTVADCVIDDNLWNVQHLVIDAAGAPAGSSVLIAPPRWNRVNHRHRRISLDVSPHVIGSSPQWTGNRERRHGRAAVHHTHHPARPADPGLDHSTPDDFRQPRQLREQA